MNSSKSIKKEFLMALYDDEGSVVPQGKKAEIRLYSVNLKGLKQIQKILLEFGIENRLREGYGSRRNVYGVIVKNLKLFHKEIGFYCIRKQQKLEKMSPPTRI